LQLKPKTATVKHQIMQNNSIFTAISGHLPLLQLPLFFVYIFFSSFFSGTHHFALGRNVQQTYLKQSFVSRLGQKVVQRFTRCKWVAAAAATAATTRAAAATATATPATGVWESWPNSKSSIAATASLDDAIVAACH